MFKAGKSKIDLARFRDKWQEFKKLGVVPNLRIEVAFVRMFSFYGAHDLAQKIYTEMRAAGMELDASTFALIISLARKSLKASEFWAQEVKKLGMEQEVEALRRK
jgi:hypothetical protein